MDEFSKMHGDEMLSKNPNYLL